MIIVCCATARYNDAKPVQFTCSTLPLLWSLLNNIIHSEQKEKILSTSSYPSPCEKKGFALTQSNLEAFIYAPKMRKTHPKCRYRVSNGASRIHPRSFKRRACIVQPFVASYITAVFSASNASNELTYWSRSSAYYPFVQGLVSYGNARFAVSV